MFRPVVTFATIASVALIAGPALAQMKMSSPTMGGGGGGLTWGAYAGFETDNSLPTWGPAVGLNLDWDMGGPMNVVLMPRFTYGMGYQSAIKLPITLRKEVKGQAGIFGGLGLYGGYGLGAGTASPSMDAGALLEAGLGMPMGNMTLEIGAEAGYGFMNPGKAALPWTAMFKVGGRM